MQFESKLVVSLHRHVKIKLFELFGFLFMKKKTGGIIIYYLFNMFRSIM